MAGAVPRELDVIERDIEVLAGILNAHLRRRSQGEVGLHERIARYEELMQRLRAERAEALHGPSQEER